MHKTKENRRERQVRDRMCCCMCRIEKSGIGIFE